MFGFLSIDPSTMTPSTATNDVSGQANSQRRPKRSHVQTASGHERTIPDDGARHNSRAEGVFVATCSARRTVWHLRQINAPFGPSESQPRPLAQ